MSGDLDRFPEWKGDMNHIENVANELSKRTGTVDGSTQEPVVQLATEANVSRTASVQSARTHDELIKAFMQEQWKASTAMYHQRKRMRLDRAAISQARLAAWNEALDMLVRFVVNVTAESKDASVDRAD